MINLNIPVGISDLARIRQNEYYYVDKSGLVSEIVEEHTSNGSYIDHKTKTFWKNTWNEYVIQLL